MDAATQDRVRALLEMASTLDADDLDSLEGVWTRRREHERERGTRTAEFARALDVAESRDRADDLRAALEELRRRWPLHEGPGDPAEDGGAQVFEQALAALVVWDLLDDTTARDLYLPLSEWWEDRRPRVPSPFLAHGSRDGHGS